MFDINAQIFQELLVFVVDQGFEDDGFRTVCGFVGQGMEDKTEFADLGAVELGVGSVASKAGIGSHDHAVDIRAMAQGVHHFLQGFTVLVVGARTSFIDVDMLEDQSVLVAPGTDFVFLLLGGEFLVFVAGIAQVGDSTGSGWEWGFIAGHN